MDTGHGMDEHIFRPWTAFGTRAIPVEGLFFKTSQNPGAFNREKTLGKKKLPDFVMD